MFLSQSCIFIHEGLLLLLLRRFTLLLQLDSAFAAMIPNSLLSLPPPISPSNTDFRYFFLIHDRGFFSLLQHQRAFIFIQHFVISFFSSTDNTAAISSRIPFSSSKRRRYFYSSLINTKTKKKEKKNFKIYDRNRKLTHSSPFD